MTVKSLPLYSCVSYMQCQSTTVCLFQSHWLHNISTSSQGLQLTLTSLWRMETPSPRAVVNYHITWLLFNQQGVAVLSGVRPLAADEEQKAGAPDVPSPRYICRMLNHQLSVTVSGSLRALWLPLPLLWKLSALSNTHTQTLTHAHTPPASLLWPVLSVLMKAVTSVWRWQWVLIWVCVSVFVRTCVSSTRAATPAYKHANGAVKGMLNSSPCCLMLK